jgi:AcrR family transcriptional regulator
MSAEDRRRQILDVASDLVRQSGAGNLTMEAIAEGAGVSKPLIYLHFTGTADVLLNLMREECERLDAQVFVLLTQAQSLDEQLDALMRPYLDLLEERGSLFDELVIRQSNREVLDRWQAERRSGVVDFLAALICDGRDMDQRQASIAATGLLGAFESAARLLTLPGADRREVEHVLRCLVRGGLESLEAIQ